MSEPTADQATSLPAIVPVTAVLVDEPSESPPLRPLPSDLPASSPLTAVLENRTYVITILLCVGPLGLPALWFSPRFTRRFKIITTSGYFLITAVLPIAIAWYFLDVAIRPVVNALGQ